LLFTIKTCEDAQTIVEYVIVLYNFDYVTICRQR